MSGVTNRQACHSDLEHATRNNRGGTREANVSFFSHHILNSATLRFGKSEIGEGDVF